MPCRLCRDRADLLERIVDRDLVRILREIVAERLHDLLLAAQRPDFSRSIGGVVGKEFGDRVEVECVDRLVPAAQYVDRVAHTSIPRAARSLRSVGASVNRTACQPAAFAPSTFFWLSSMKIVAAGSRSNALTWWS